MRTRSLSLVLLAIAACSQAELTVAEKTQVIQELSKTMIERYVLRDKAEEVAALLNKNLKEGAYDSLNAGPEFAKAISEHINSVCRDAHLRLRYSADVLPIRKDRNEPSPAEIAAEKKFVKLGNAGFREVRRMDGNIGYIEFRGFMDPKMAERPVRAAMEFVKDTDALIFDLRDNGGGEPDTVALICSYLFDKPTHINSLIMREGKKMKTYDYKTHTVRGAKYLKKPVYVLVSKRTGSAAEEFTYNLQTQKRAVIVGENTWGGANPGGMVRLTDHFAAFVPVGMARNPITGKNWEGTGVTPDVRVTPADALKLAQQLAVKKLLETATGEDKERLESVLKQLGG